MKIKKGSFKVGRGLWLEGAERAPDGYLDALPISYFTEGAEGVLICVARSLGFSVWCRNTNYSAEIILERRGVEINVGGNCRPESFDAGELIDFACMLVSYCRRRPKSHSLWDPEGAAAPEWADVTYSDAAERRIQRAKSAWMRKQGIPVSEWAGDGP